MAATKEELDGQRKEAVGDAPAALTVLCTVDEGEGHLVVEVGAGADLATVCLTRELVALANDARIDPLTLLACALGTDPDKAVRPHPVGGTSQPTGEALVELQRAYSRTSVDREIEVALRDGVDVVLIGEYGSGKTATATIHTHRCEGDERYGVVWLDLTDIADGAESVMLALLRMGRRDRYLIFVDSVQANPAAFEAVARCVRRLRQAFKMSVQILATAWPRLVTTWREPFKDFREVSARPDELIHGILDKASVPAGQRRQIVELVDHDVHLAVDAVDFYRRHRRVPTWSDLQSALTEGVEDLNSQKALYWFASLGFFGLDASATAVEKYFSTDVVARLARTKKKLLAHTDGRYSIPSHARAALVMRHAIDVWQADVRWDPPHQLAWEHMQRSGDRVIRATLGRLDLVGVSGKMSSVFHESTRYLARAWEMFTQLGHALTRRCHADPSWGDNVGAAIFAAHALVVMDKQDDWQRVADYIRGRWVYAAGQAMPSPVGEPSAESNDFDRILEQMRAEDAESPRAPHVEADPADTIDMRCFYRMWMLAALLGFEGTAPHRDRERFNALQDMAEREIDAEGFFEPRRVPWVTARMIIALCQAGKSYQTSGVVRRACDWLRRPVAADGPFDSYWHSGTGGWNTDVATTAMCLTALLRAGAPADNEVRAGLLWLQTREEEWSRPGREIDLALVLEAMLLGNEHQKVYQRVLDLLSWVKRELRRPESARDDRTPEAGLRRPFVAAQLASFVWATVTREYRALMQLQTEHRGRAGAAVTDEAGRPALPQNRSSQEALVAAAAAEPRLNVEAWRRALDQLDNAIVKNLNSRNLVVRQSGGTSVVLAKIEEYKQLRRKAQALAEKLREDTDPAVLREIDTIGRRVCGTAWPDLEVPAPPGGAGELGETEGDQA